MINLRNTISAFAASTILFSSCSNDESMSRIRIVMVDAPADYQEVNVEVEDILIHTETEAGEAADGWVSVITAESKGKIYNLLDLVNGEEALLADTEFPTGKLSQIRLVLGDDNTLKINDQIIPLSTPSAQQSGLKLQVNQNLQEEFTYNFILDFDAAQSVVATGAANKYNLKPVIKCSAEENSGAIEGIVALIGEKAYITAIQGDNIYSTYTDESGGFMLKGVAPGVYQIKVDFPENDIDEAIEAVEVEIGEITELGAISFALAK
jgi:hypothetical protein